MWSGGGRFSGGGDVSPETDTLTGTPCTAQAERKCFQEPKGWGGATAMQVWHGPWSAEEDRESPFEWVGRTIVLEGQLSHPTATESLAWDRGTKVVLESWIFTDNFAAFSEASWP